MDKNEIQYDLIICPDNFANDSSHSTELQCWIPAVKVGEASRFGTVCPSTKGQTAVTALSSRSGQKIPASRFLGGFTLVNQTFQWEIAYKYYKWFFK